MTFGAGVDPVDEARQFGPEFPCWTGFEVNTLSPDGAGDDLRRSLPVVPENSHAMAESPLQLVGNGAARQPGRRSGQCDLAACRRIKHPIADTLDVALTRHFAGLDDILGQRRRARPSTPCDPDIGQPANEQALGKTDVGQRSGQRGEIERQAGQSGACQMQVWPRLVMGKNGSHCGAARHSPQAAARAMSNAHCGAAAPITGSRHTCAATVTRLYAGAYQLDQKPKEWELALLFVRAFRSLDSLVKWLASNNRALNGRPVDLISTTEGLVRVVHYLDASRGLV